MTQKDTAQSRADQIRAFNAELAALSDEGVLALDAEDQARVNVHHNALLQNYAQQFDIDISGTDKQLSWGMRIVSFIGALALSAALFFFFYRFWGVLGTTTQVGILVVTPLVATMGIKFAAQREKTLYFASLLALIAFTCFVLNLSVLGVIFNITPTQNAFIAWGAFALVLAYTYGLRLQLVAGMACILGYLAATIGTWSGCYWLSFAERPENFILAGILLAAAAAIPHRQQTAFPGLYRGFGLLTIFIAILVLANWGQISYLPWDSDIIEGVYQVSGFLFSGGTIALAIKRGWPGTTNLASTFFTLYLYTKLFDWWWDWLPKYLFFLLLGLIAVGLLLALKRIRSMTRGGAA